MNAVAKIEQHNPIGTDGFEFVEFTAPDAKGIEQLRQLFNMMGFTETAKHRSKEVFLFQQNDINIVLNGSPTGHVHEFALKHGPSACAMAFRVKNASQAAAYAESQGAKLVGSHANFGEPNIPSLKASAVRCCILSTATATAASMTSTSSSSKAAAPTTTPSA